MKTISVNAYITANFTKPIQQKIRLAIKQTYTNSNVIDNSGNKIKGYRGIFMDQISPDKKRSEFLMGAFKFVLTHDCLFWLKYVTGLRKQEEKKEKTNGT